MTNQGPLPPSLVGVYTEEEWRTGTYAALSYFAREVDQEADPWPEKVQRARQVLTGLRAAGWKVAPAGSPEDPMIEPVWP